MKKTLRNLTVIDNPIGQGGTLEDPSGNRYQIMKHSSLSAKPGDKLEVDVYDGLRGQVEGMIGGIGTITSEKETWTVAEVRVVKKS